MQSNTCCASAILAMLSFGALAASTKEDTPGTPEYFATYIDGRYGYTNGVMYTLRHTHVESPQLLQAQGPTSVAPVLRQITGVVLQKIDAKKLQVGIKVPLQALMGQENASIESAYLEPAVLVVEDSSRYVEGETVACWAVELERHTGKTATGETLILPAYRTPVPHAITFTQYAALVKANASTPDRFPKLVSCESRAALVEYAFSITNGVAAITRFNLDYAGDLNVTNTLGGCPVTEIAPSAFSDCRALTSVRIPEGVTKISDWAFNRCYALTNVTLSSTVNEIGNLAFSRCMNLPPSVRTRIESKMTRRTATSPLFRRGAPVPGMSNSTTNHALISRVPSAPGFADNQSYMERLRERKAQENQATKEQQEHLQELARKAAAEEIKRREAEANSKALEPAQPPVREENNKPIP